MTDAAVVIGNYEGAALLPDCLESLEAQTHQPAEVIVADGASSDDSVHVARRYGATVLEERNGGLGYLYNRGAEAASSPLVLLLNNDVALRPDCLERLVDALVANERRFAADPTQLAWESDDVIHARSTLTPGRLVRELIPGFHLDLAVPADTTVPTLTANGGAMLVRRDRLLALGGFDDRFFMEIEDLDLCWRAWLRGWESVYVPAAVVRHRVGAATGVHEHALRLRSGHHNLLRFALKCFPVEAAARVVLGELLRLPVHPRLVAPALLEIGRTLPGILRERRRVRPSRAVFRWLTSGQHGPLPG